MDGTSALVLTIGGIAGLTAVIALPIIWWVRRQAYEGVVARKETTDNVDEDGPSTYYYLIVDQNDGKSRSVRVARKLWESFAVGDAIVKRSGKLNPEHA